MKKTWWLVVFALLTSLRVESVCAQYVTIPDSNFVNWLQTNYPGCMNGNQMDTTCQAILDQTLWVAVDYANISNLEGIKYFKNVPSVTCSHNNLTSLPELPLYLDFLNRVEVLVTK